VKLLQPKIDGRSLVPVLKSADAPGPHDVLHWHVSGGKNPQWAVREGDWKLIGNAMDTTVGDRKPERFPLWLSHLADDIGERNNRAAERPDLVARLKKLHDDWAAPFEKPEAK
jgi:arylsulfatase A-like enzyme